MEIKFVRFMGNIHTWMFLRFVTPSSCNVEIVVLHSFYIQCDKHVIPTEKKGLKKFKFIIVFWT